MKCKKCDDRTKKNKDLIDLFELVFAQLVFILVYTFMGIGIFFWFTSSIGELPAIMLGMMFVAYIGILTNIKVKED